MRKPLAYIERHAVRVDLSSVFNSSVREVARLAEALDVLEGNGYRVSYFHRDRSNKPAELGTKSRKKHTGSRPELSPSEVRNYILNGFCDGKGSREIYDELKSQHGTDRFTCNAHWKYIHNGTYCRRGLLQA